MSELECTEMSASECTQCRHSCQVRRLHVRTTCGKKEQLVAKNFSLGRNSSLVGMEHFVGILFMSGWNTLSKYFSCQDGTLCPPHFVNLNLQWVVEVVVWV